MQVPNNTVESIIPILLFVSRTAGENWPEATELRDKLIRCQERDKLKVAKRQDNDTELHENIYTMAGMFTDWMNAGNDPDEVFTGGTGQAMEDVIGWAKEFTNKNKGRAWDGEWYDEIEEFFHDKIKNA